MKKIGIVGWNTGENSFGATKPYLDWLSQFGDVEILTPKLGIVADLDLLILPGGADIAPQSYGAVPGYFTSNTDVMKQYFYDNNLDQYINAGIPIFGICLGFQQLCVKFGGVLEQHWPFNYSNKNRGELVDKLTFNGDYPKGKYEVNSLHHQGCFELPLESMVIARETSSQNIEIAKFKNNIYGVQYHPEEINDPFANSIIKTLLNINY